MTVDGETMYESSPGEGSNSEIRIKPESGKTVRGNFWQVYTGDARCILKTIDSNSVDCVVTSPPYFWLRDYGVENQMGLEGTIDGYIDNLMLVMDQVHRVLKDTGVLFLNLGDTYYSGKGRAHGRDEKSRKRRFGLRAVDKSGGMGMGLRQKTMIGMPWRSALAMIERNWILRSDIIWHRKYALPEAAKDRPRRSYEHIFLFVKGRHYYFNRKPLETSEQEDMWTIAARPKYSEGLDTAPFPDELVEQCLAIGCPQDGTVLDPFAGSGTTLRVALQQGFNAIGVELNPIFSEHVVNMLRQE